MDFLYEFDDAMRAGHGDVICGVDEAGRGPLAGPVCCAAVVLDSTARYSGLKDSKKLTEATRERLYDEIIATATAYSIIMIDNNVIDEINILKATMLGMKQATENLGISADLVLVDGNRAPHCGANCMPVVKGDTKSASIAAASVLAKVSRDRYMQQLDAEFPEYGFAKHKGYPTKMHYLAIDCHGITPYHRVTFLKNRVKI